MMHILAAYNGGADIGVTAAELQDFASRWPCFGSQTAPVDFRGAALFMSFDAKGDLVDLAGDEGLDEAGVSALVDDARIHANACGYKWPAR